jgi:hypothetical protein
MLQQRDMWQWIDKLPVAPLLLVSYQRGVAQPLALACALNAFLGTGATAERIAKAAQRISPTGGYLTQEET